jgi:hypothetical protein
MECVFAAKWPLPLLFLVISFKLNMADRHELPRIVGCCYGRNIFYGLVMLLLLIAKTLNKKREQQCLSVPLVKA